MTSPTENPNRIADTPLPTGDDMRILGWLTSVEGQAPPTVGRRLLMRLH